MKAKKKAGLELISPTVHIDHNTHSHLTTVWSDSSDRELKLEFCAGAEVVQTTNVLFRSTLRVNDSDYF